jgi:hypothetical protein
MRVSTGRPLLAKAKRKQPAKKKAASKKKAAAKKPAAKKRAVANKPAQRADYGAPIDGFFVKQPPHLREILEALRELVEEVVPEAKASIKWGMPFYSLDGVMMCAIAGHKAHVNLILAGAPGVFDDPDGLLTGEAKGGRHLKLAAIDELPRAAVRGWLKTAASIARRR